MKKFQMTVPVSFTVTVEAKDRETAIRRFRTYVLSSAVDLKGWMDSDIAEWGEGRSAEDMDWESFEEIAL